MVADIKGVFKLLFLCGTLVGCECMTGSCNSERTASKKPAAESAAKPVSKPSVRATKERPTKERFQVRRGRLYTDGAAVSSISYFGFDSSGLARGHLEDLRVHARYLSRNRNQRISIEGHCDERGTREYNLALGDLRAKRVADYLISRGVLRSQIRTVSFGEEKPVDLRRTDAGYAKNRRAVIIYQ